jgi:thiosulfate/3-mercaptopyruvate sulfurtransferase
MRLSPALCRRALAAAVLAAAFAERPPHAGAQSPRDRMIVSPQWVAAHLHDANLVVLHVGDTAGYRAEHIPGARLVRLSDVSTPHDMADTTKLMLQIPDAATLHQKLQGLGISDNSRIVVYYGGDWVSPATRVVYTLLWAGLGDRTVLMDGGLNEWKAEHRPVTTAVPAATAGRLSALRPRTETVVDAAWVHTNGRAAHVALVDARDSSFYMGIQKTRNRAGHVPGARSIPFTALTDDRLHVRSTAELADVFRRAGVKPGDTVVGYCHIGQQATAMLFAARLLGYPVKLYDGSFEDWDRHTEYPVENPSATAGR